MRRLGSVLLSAALSFRIEVCALAQATTFMQPASGAAPVNAALPEAIYWKQSLFQIPYQWSSAAEPGSAQVVWLLVSKDRGTTWQKISEAKPHVKSFNYRAEAEGEYWFAVRTLDHQGRAWPAGAYQPELRVIVDTTMPRIESLQANRRSDGTIEVQWRGFDLNLDSSSWRIEAQAEPLGNWQALHAAGSGEQGAGNPNCYALASIPGGVSTGQTLWQPPAGLLPVAIRATVFDRAGNSASFQTEIKAATSTAIFQRLPPTDSSGLAPTGLPVTNQFDAPRTAELGLAPAAAPMNSSPQGWISSSDPAVASAPATQSADQLWPASTTARAPFRLSSSGAITPDDAVTAYGNPSGADAPLVMNVHEDERQIDTTGNDRYAMNGEPHAAVNGANSFDSGAGPVFQPVPPFRQASVARLPTTSVDSTQSADVATQTIGPVAQDDRPLPNANASQFPFGVHPKLVGSRTFALEYDLEQVGRWGVSNVELWGTRDGGQTWRSYARDDDQRSPLVATVDEEGVYGFRIVVESAGGATAVPPRSGDAPELWVAVDLQRPVAELTAIEPGAGNLSDHLRLQWRADDNNLEPRPISLFYSSRPTGPWSAIATNLQNTGEYAWRVERHVPTRFFLRLEARDTAGNLAAFQTRDPVQFAMPAASGRLRSAEPADPTAISGAASYR